MHVAMIRKGVTDLLDPLRRRNRVGSAKVEAQRAGYLAGPLENTLHAGAMPRDDAR